MTDQQLLEEIYVAQVLALAHSIQSEKARKGTQASLSGCITEAQNLMDSERGQILARIADTR